MKISPNVSIFSLKSSNILSSSLDLNMGVRGEYLVRKINRKGEIVAEVHVNNTVTTEGLSLLTESGSLLAWSDAAIVVLDDNSKKTTNNLIETSNVNSSEPPYRCTRTSIFEFSAGEVVGNVVLIGTGRHSNGTFFAYSPVINGFGEISNLPVNSDEKLQILYSIVLDIPTETYIFNLMFQQTPVECSIRAQNIVDNSFSQTNPIETGWNLNGSSTFSGRYPVRLAKDSLSSTGCARPIAYSDTILSNLTGTPRNLGTFSNNEATTVDTISGGPASSIGKMYWQPSDGNVEGGIGRICFRTGRDGANGFPTTNWNMVFSPKIPKNIYYGLEIEIIFTFSENP